MTTTTSGHLAENIPIANNVETTVFTLTLPAGTHSLKYAIAFQPAETLASYQKGYMWVNDQGKELIVSNLCLPRDWPTLKEITTEITSDGTTPILIKALVQAEHPVELMHKREITEKDMYGNDVTKTQGCYWEITSP